MSLLHVVPLIVLAPFLVGALIILCAPFHSRSWMKPIAMLLSIGAVSYGLVQSLSIFNELQLHPLLTPEVHNLDWFVSSTFKLSVGYLVDNLAVVMLIIVTVISLLVQIYTHGYMHEDPGYCRFYAYLSLFTGSMLGLVVSSNLFEMYFFWELVGVCSYFLIGFWWYKPSAAAAALKAFVINRIGDCGFLIGIIMLLAGTYQFWQGHTILSFYDRSGFDLTAAIHWAQHNGTMSAAYLTIAGLLIFMGPMAKSAQMPLHVWLPDAMEGPTPISALIHAATMVAAGVYLVARAYPIWLAPDGSTHSTAFAVIAWVGTITAFMAATIGMSQFDIKRVLAWSTVSQLGYMFAGLGTGAYTAGIFHLFNHAFFKAMLFLCSGAVIHGLSGEQDIRQMGGLWKKMPITATCFLIGTLSISGFPIFSGFFSKDQILDSASHFSVGPFSEWMGPLLSFTAALTAFYMFRVFFMTFTGSYRGTAHAHESPPSMTIPLIALAIPSMVSGYLGVNTEAIKQLFAGQPATAFSNLFTRFVHFGPTVEYEAFNTHIMLVSLAAFAIGTLTAYLIYCCNWKVNSWVEKHLTTAYKFSLNKWYFDELYLGFTEKILLPFYRRLWSLVDQYIVDNLVNFSGFAAIGSGEILKYTQNGRGQYYALVVFACVAGLSLIIFFGAS
jgi:NAD(P)H-quinone oxidoreductase subunit 5